MVLVEVGIVVEFSVFCVDVLCLVVLVVVN